MNSPWSIPSRHWINCNRQQRAKDEDPEISNISSWRSGDNHSPDFQSRHCCNSFISWSQNPLLWMKIKLSHKAIADSISIAIVCPNMWPNIKSFRPAASPRGETSLEEGHIQSTTNILSWSRRMEFDKQRGNSYKILCNAHCGLNGQRCSFALVASWKGTALHLSCG